LLFLIPKGLPPNTMIHQSIAEHANDEIKHNSYKPGSKTHPSQNSVFTRNITLTHPQWVLEGPKIGKIDGNLHVRGGFLRGLRVNTKLRFKIV